MMLSKLKTLRFQMIQLSNSHNDQANVFESNLPIKSGSLEFHQRTAGTKLCFEQFARRS